MVVDRVFAVIQLFYDHVALIIVIAHAIINVERRGSILGSDVEGFEGGCIPFPIAQFVSLGGIHL